MQVPLPVLATTKSCRAHAWPTSLDTHPGSLLAGHPHRPQRHYRAIADGDGNILDSTPHEQPSSPGVKPQATMADPANQPNLARQQG